MRFSISEIAKRIFSEYLWNMPVRDKSVYLTFDDGPIPWVTPWVLEQLREYEAKATFFCIGDNIQKHPEVFDQILRDGHSVGNHTYNHLKGWKTSNPEYFQNIIQCQELLKGVTTTRLFRPPYGKIKPSQGRVLIQKGYVIVMWDVLTLDYDAQISIKDSLEKTLKNIRPGSIIVFHDSQKAYPKLRYMLPEVLEFLRQNGYICQSING